MQNKRKAWGHSARYRAALPGVRAVVHHTPIMRCGSVSRRLRSRTDLVLNCEHLQRTGSFKIRGRRCIASPSSLAAMLKIVAEERGNVLSITHDRLRPIVALGMTGVELLVEVRDKAH